MSHEHHEEHPHCHCNPKLCMDIAKLVLKAATVAVAVCMAKEIHKVHKAIEAHKK